MCKAVLVRLPNKRKLKDSYHLPNHVPLVPPN